MHPEVLRKAKGANLLFSLNQEKPETRPTLFNSLIESIVPDFHNFAQLGAAFYCVESMTWGKCKNMLLILGNVAKMLPVKSESACSLTLAPGHPHLFSQDYWGKSQ